MNRENPFLEVREHLLPNYINGTILSILTALVLFLIYLSISDIFWTSVLRFSAFVFLAFAFYTFYKALDERITLQLFENQEGCRIDLIQGDRLIEQEQLQQGGSVSIQTLSGISKWHTCQIKLPNNHLLSYNDRPLLFTNRNAQMIRDALEPANA